MNKTTKRHLISALITFLSAFLLVIANNLSIDMVDTASIFALFVTATRAGIKALVEFLPKLLNE